MSAIKSLDSVWNYPMVPYIMGILVSVAFIVVAAMVLEYHSDHHPDNDDNSDDAAAAATAAAATPDDPTVDPDDLHTTAVVGLVFGIVGAVYFLPGIAVRAYAQSMDDSAQVAPLGM